MLGYFFSWLPLYHCYNKKQCIEDNSTSLYMLLRITWTQKKGLSFRVLSRWPPGTCLFVFFALHLRTQRNPILVHHETITQPIQVYHVTAESTYSCSIIIWSCLIQFNTYKGRVGCVHTCYIVHITYVSVTMPITSQ